MKKITDMFVFMCIAVASLLFVKGCGFEWTAIVMLAFIINELRSKK